MDEYIKREEAIHIAFKSPFFSDSLMEEINALPAADVAPVRHGQWISFLDGDYIMPERYYRCSRSGRVESSRQPYCHCGAKMDLEEQNAASR